MITIKPSPKSYLDLLKSKIKVHVDGSTDFDFVVIEEKVKTLKVFSSALPVIKQDGKIVSRIINYQRLEYRGKTLNFYLGESRVTSGESSYALESIPGSIMCSKYKVFHKKKEIGTITDKMSVNPFGYGSYLSFQSVSEVFDRCLGFSLLVMYIEADRYYREAG